MPTPNPTLRREYKGAAAATTLVNPMTNTDISFVLVAANNWPTGSVGKFVVTINRGQADEEKILCDSQTTRTVACLLANRGFDGTGAQSHSAGATVECTISAFDADEWNAHTNATTGVHGVAGAVVGTTDSQTLTNKGLTSPSISSPALSGQPTGNLTGPTFTAVSVFTNSWVSGAEAAGYAIDAAGFVVLRGSITAGTIGTAAFTLPVGLRPAVNHQFSVYSDNGAGTIIVAGVTVQATGVVFVGGGNNAVIALNNIRFKAEQ